MVLKAEWKYVEELRWNFMRYNSMVLYYSSIILHIMVGWKITLTGWNFRRILSVTIFADSKQHHILTLFATAFFSPVCHGVGGGGSYWHPLYFLIGKWYKVETWQLVIKWCKKYFYTKKCMLWRHNFWWRHHLCNYSKWSYCIAQNKYWSITMQKNSEKYLYNNMQHKENM